MADTTTFQAVGRRKAAVARVWLRPGGGSWTINGRPIDEYFPMDRHREKLRKPFTVAGMENQFDVHARVSGGGSSGQADALQLATARAILQADGDTRAALRAHDLLTRDPRVVERKKPGQPKARKRFQFSKR